MTIITLMIYVAIAAAILTGLTVFVLKAQKSILMTYVQHFCGSLFIFSGYVKAVDPLGTAFKMEQYFAEFYYTFNETALSFIAPMFPWMSEHGLLISVAMIVFEIALGVMLIVGARPKLTAWLFFLLVVFFTILT
ncbi:MAG: DoxX family membrane protein, partial [Bacteroidetes bacterium]